MTTKKPELLIRELLTCSIIMEKNVAELFFELHRKTRDPVIKLLFKTIALESSNHASILEDIADTYGLKQEGVDCREYHGEQCIIIESVLNQLKNTSEVSLEELKIILEKLVILENFIAEETYHKLLLPLVIDLLPNNTDLIVQLINKIVVDEEFHEKTIKSILGRIKSQ